MKRLFITAGLLLASVAAFAQTAPAPAGEEALLKADRDFNSATQAKRLEGWMSYMADDVILLRGKPLFGAEAVRAELKEEWADPNHSLTWEPTHAEMFKSGKMGYTSGRWVYHGVNEKGEKLKLEGNYLTVWRQEADGSWKVIWDGGTSDPKPDPKK